MDYIWRAWCLLTLGITLATLVSCENFRLLGIDLEALRNTHSVSGRIDNFKEFTRVYAGVIEWDRAADKVDSADFCEVGNVGVFTFLVKRQNNQYLFAFSDENGDGEYDPGEAAWFEGEAVQFRGARGDAQAHGRLSSNTLLPAELAAPLKSFFGGESPLEAATKRNVPLAVGETVSLDEPRFAAARGSEGIWRPASFPLEVGIGIYFLEEYDPSRIPVLFVYGAAGSPQDWQTVFRELDREQFQPWFFFYPTGQRLNTMGEALNAHVKLLEENYDFDELYVVAHSMGGLVARSFVLKNFSEGHDYIERLITISSPWGGHEAAGLGVRRAPKVVPSWRDMRVGSDFQKSLFIKKLPSEVDYLLIYGNKASSSPILPKENDGTVSLASMTKREAIEDADKVITVHADHVGILSSPSVIEQIEEFLTAD